MLRHILLTMTNFTKSLIYLRVPSLTLQPLFLKVVSNLIYHVLGVFGSPGFGFSDSLVLGLCVVLGLSGSGVLRLSDSLILWCIWFPRSLASASGLLGLIGIDSI